MPQHKFVSKELIDPLEFGISNEGVYTIQTWIDGVDAEENAHNLTNNGQYSYGYEAGRILKEIHKIPAPDGMINQAKDVLCWYDDMKNPVPARHKGVISK